GDADVRIAFQGAVQHFLRVYGGGLVLLCWSNRRFRLGAARFGRSATIKDILGFRGLTPRLAPGEISGKEHHEPCSPSNRRSAHSVSPLVEPFSWRSITMYLQRKWTILPPAQR